MLETLECQEELFRQKPSSSSLNIKSNCYKSMVGPIVKYSLSVWYPHTTSIVQLEADITGTMVKFYVQKRLT